MITINCDEINCKGNRLGICTAAVQITNSRECLSKELIYIPDAVIPAREARREECVFHGWFKGDNNLTSYHKCYCSEHARVHCDFICEFFVSTK
jgi:hypothetical protein